MSVGPLMDPALVWMLRCALALLLLAAGGHKLRYAAEFRGSVEGYRLLPQRVIPALAASLPLVEIGLGLGLLLPASASASASLTAALFALYGAAIVVNLARGRRHIDCGCGGRAGRAGISEGLVVRNAVLIALACAAAFEPGPRPLLWLDLPSIGVGAVTLALLYVAADGLLANAPRLVPHRSPR